VWRCVERKCPGGFITDKENIENLKIHNHDASFNKAEAGVLQANITNRALTTTEKPKDIINRYLCGESFNIGYEIAKYNSMVDNITRVHRKIKIICCFDHEKLPEELHFSLYKEKVLFYKNRSANI
jgi:hypothetical protein